MIVQAKATHLPFRTGSVDCVVTSPPYYGRRKYGDDDSEIGTESLADYLHNMTDVFREVRRCLTASGTAWVVVGDSSAGSGGAGGDYNKGGSKDSPIHRKYRQAKPTVDLPTRPVPSLFNPNPAWEHIESTLPTGNWCLVPTRLADHLQGDGWILRHVITWDKTNIRPESTDHTKRPGESAETILMLSKSMTYTWNGDALPSHPSTVDDLESIQVGEVVTAGRVKWMRVQGGWISSKNLATATHEQMSKMSPRMVVDNGSVWRIKPGKQTGHNHPAVFPESLVERAVLLTTNPGDVVMDPFVGSGTTVDVATRLGRRGVGADLYRWG